jgi:hypothetical protein
MFLGVPRPSGPFFTFGAPGHVFGGTEGVGSRFFILRARTHFRRYRGRRVSFSCFARPDSLSAVPRASGPVFMFCAPRLIFGGTEGVVSRFHVFGSTEGVRSLFHVLRPLLIFGGTEGVGSPFHVFRSRTRFRRYRWRRDPFSCFATELNFGGTKGVEIRYSCFARP